MQQHGKTFLFEDMLTLATKLPWWMDWMMAIFAYIGFHLWQAYFLHEINPINEPVQGGKPTPAWRGLLLFNGYFHGETGLGLGAMHQTGRSGLVANLIQRSYYSGSCGSHEEL
ncbi:hypothetical protein HF563_01800 [Acidithiobacillus ferridurans]|nr:hypothetical protein [Acidithiobacillus ferridurans]